MRIALVNPNTDAAVTSAMCEIARRRAPPGLSITGHTATFGVPLITDAVALSEAARAVAAFAPQLAHYDGVVVSAFGDPGVEALRDVLECPVVGIAEAAMRAAGAGGRAFAVATTTPDLCEAIAARAVAYGHANFVGTWVTPGDPRDVMADHDTLAAALLSASQSAVKDGGAQAVIVGGGPLARVAETMRGCLSVPVIAPIPEAIDLIAAYLMEER
ncbi:aspartate/glutamate racemase family protein [Palleronia sp. LCG004]|uniref:aspartate/glutamate racemase family protein n=1 Tax=Palleronia sp. LCG004 TaxID=3079304 RepID=UPI00294237E3|nr:aspartate/glutamate racemase family protein [Palleronia sp. LCG004]WOI57764.1 aspartate/glutamate racemase family protein [Palleronia sp. LCG004]